MFCPKCGSKNPDQAAFCSSCGINLKALNSSGTASAADKTYHNEKNRTELRKKEIEKLSMIIEYFSKIPARYYAYDNTCNMIEISKKKLFGLLIWGIILIVLSFVYGIGAIVMLSIGKTENLGACIFAAITFFLVGPMLIVLFIVTSRARNRSYSEAIIRYDKLTEELYNYYLAYDNCAVGCEYTNPANLDAILKTIQSGSADTIEEAINILTGQNLQRSMREMSQHSARSAAASARGVKNAVVFYSARFFTG